MEGQLVKVPLSKLVIGLANGWAKGKEGHKTLYLQPEDLTQAHQNLLQKGATPRGSCFGLLMRRGQTASIWPMISISSSSFDRV